MDPAVLFDHAQQHLEEDAAPGAGAQRVDALAEEPEAVLLQGLADAQHPVHFAVAADEGGVVFLVDLDAVAPLLLGHVAGMVGGGQQVGDRLEIAGDRHQADARRDGKGFVLPVEAQLAQGALELAHLPFGGQQRGARQQHAEFVAAQAGHRAAVADHVLQQGADAAQQLVAGQVAAGVVDQLELVQVHIAEGVGGALAGGLLQAALEVAVEGLAVEQPGGFVVAGLVGQLQRQQALVRHVLKHQHGADDARVVVADRRADAFDGVAPPVAPFERQPLRQADAHPLRDGAAHRVGGAGALGGAAVRFAFGPFRQAEDFVQRAAGGLFARPAGDPFRHRVEVLDHAGRRGGQHAVADRSQGHLGQLLFGVELGHLLFVGAGGFGEQAAHDRQLQVVGLAHAAARSDSSTRIAVWL